MSITAKERDELDAEFGRKAVDEALEKLDPQGRRQPPERLNKEQLRRAIEVLTP